MPCVPLSARSPRRPLRRAPRRGPASQPRAAAPRRSPAPPRQDEKQRCLENGWNVDNPAELQRWRDQEPINAHSHLAAMLLGSSETIPVCGGGVRMPLRPAARAATHRSGYPLACSGPRTEPERRALTVCVPKRGCGGTMVPRPQLPVPLRLASPGATASSCSVSGRA